MSMLLNLSELLQELAVLSMYPQKAIAETPLMDKHAKDVFSMELLNNASIEKLQENINPLMTKHHKRPE